MKNSNRLIPITALVLVVSLVGSLAFGLVGGYIGTRLAIRTDQGLSNTSGVQGVSVVDESSAIIDVAAKSSPSVVSVIISKNLSLYERMYLNPDGDYNLSQDQSSQEVEVGAGTGFIISADGLILTNRHVVSDTTATYTVILNDNSHLAAKVLARDTILDIAILKVDADKELVPLTLGDSDSIKIGQTAVAIGNSLGQFSNSVSAGIISGLGRSITATDSSGQSAQQLEGVIQTDASINPGNSGGPLLNAEGQVIGVNVAMAEEAENIGFAIPVNLIRPIVESVKQYGEIRRPYLGVRYVSVTKEIAKSKNLGVSYGALVDSSTGDAVLAGSPAAKAGLQKGDIILAVNGVDLNERTSLQTEIQKYRIGDSLPVKYYRGGETKEVIVTLEQMPKE